MRKQIDEYINNQRNGKIDVKCDGFHHLTYVALVFNQSRMSRIPEAHIIRLLANQADYFHV